ncbi:alternate-type signal peptide domain-containing protein [Microbacterium sp. X-17]|uniref:alternate-type signal peptide domain-containing protein n=1 Tax=Microbacterium sp. X-17 TaxID=3144404 RepID=UPI0031F48B28
MNRFAKGAIAGAAGILLLLSGAGTFALWNGSASAAAGSVQSGTMTIAADAAAGTWSVTHGSGPATAIPSIASFRAVPGDVLTFTQKVDVTATGDNLSAILSIDPTSIKAGDSSPASAALVTALTSGMTVTVGAPLPTGVTAGSAANTYTVSGTTGTKVLTVSVTLPFDSTTTGTVAQGGTVDLSALGFKLAQQ